MWPYHPELLSTPVPRYTSFPTAAEFDDSVDSTDLEAAIAATESDVSLYIHIPFCESICWYCGCNTSRNNRADRLASYVDAIDREIALLGRLLPATARIRRIAFGGGSPNAIAATDFVRLMLSLSHSLPLSDPVISVELDPRSMDATWASALAGVGVRQASLGVQTFHPELQKAIGRTQPTQMIESCTDLLRSAGVNSINFDLMYGLPGQTLGILEDTLDRASRLGANRIALFGYAHVPDLIPRQRRIDADALPDQKARFDMAAIGHAFLLEAGYSPVGFDHFALPGDPLACAALNGRLHRNFQGFTDDEAPVLIGLGASAISSFPHLLAQNEKNSGRYQMMLSHGRLTAARGIHRSVDDQTRGRIISELLCTGRATISPMLLRQAGPRLAQFARHGLVERQESEIVLSNGALPYARTIAALFDPYRTDWSRRFSTAV
ncbi:oxygen-independent coproporphyrinogen III oxidase [Novosphingobium sp. RD2P27]|uniref:Coproporphyrinogen-III oxidase n=1 Tax=Novosphingobium kalidii TaxID=3230299 RepID=A0ABV2D1B8_9SPHN